MKKLCDALNECVRELEFKDVVLLKICVCSFGLLMGLLLPKRCRKAVLIVSLLVFTATCLPLAAKLIPALKEACDACDSEK